MLKYTIARYFTPKGRMVHEKGLLPDLVVERGGTMPVDALALGGVFEDFAVEYEGKNPGLKFPVAMTQQLVSQFFHYAKQRGFGLETGWTSHEFRAPVVRRLRAAFAWLLQGVEAGEKLAYQEDPLVVQAMDLLRLRLLLYK